MFGFRNARGLVSRTGSNLLHTSWCLEKGASEMQNLKRRYSQPICLVLNV